MRSRGLTVRFRRRLHRSRVAQIGLLAGLWLAGEGLAAVSGLPLPGGVVGLGVALALLASRLVSAFSLRRGAEWFLAQMLLFFVPAVLAVLEHREFLGLLGLKVLAVILAGTAAVMGVTALTVDLFHRWRLRHEPAGPLSG